MQYKQWDIIGKILSNRAVQCAKTGAVGKNAGVLRKPIKTLFQQC